MQKTSLDDYVARKKDEQKVIYFHVDSSVNPTFNETPFTEKLLKLGYEVLYMDETIDEYLMHSVREFKGMRFVNVTRDELEIPSESEDEVKNEDDDELVAKIAAILGKDKVEKVIITDRLVDSPCVITTAQHGWTANMEKIMSSQTNGVDPSMITIMRPRRVLEINVNNPLVKHVRSMILDASEEAPGFVALMYDAACIASGFALTDPGRIASSIFLLLKRGCAPLRRSYADNNVDIVDSVELVDSGDIVELVDSGDIVDSFELVDSGDIVDGVELVDHALNSDTVKTTHGLHRVHVYIICMQDVPERLDSAREIKRQLEIYPGACVDIVPAVVGASISTTDIQAFRASGVLAPANGPGDRLFDMYNREIVNSQYGCALSHIQAYRMIETQEREFGIVIEDDVEVLGDFASKLNSLLECIKETEIDMVNMYMWPHDKVKLSSSSYDAGHLIRVPPQGYFGAQCILFKKDRMCKVLKKILPLCNPIDDQIAGVGLEYMTVCNVDFVKQRDIPSSMRGLCLPTTCESNHLL
jgi:hypothetical protein